MRKPQKVRKNIAAMKKVLEQYEKFVYYHEESFGRCPLCTENASDCDTCPWKFMTDYSCISGESFNSTPWSLRQFTADNTELDAKRLERAEKRIPSLQDWIKVYESYLIENRIKRFFKNLFA